MDKTYDCPNSYLLQEVSIVGKKNTDILITQGKIAAMGIDAGKEKTLHTKIIPAQGLIALPGLVDLHTHLRQPGDEEAEDVYTASRAGAAGGFTCLHAMPNTNPVTDNSQRAETIVNWGKRAGYLEVRPVGAVSKNLAGETLSQLESMAHGRARVRIFSDDGKCVVNPLLMRRALECVKKFGGVIAQHAQDPQLSIAGEMNEGELSGKLGLPGWPAIAEESIIARDVILAKHSKSRLHICHLSTAGSVEILRWAKAQGINVTAEVCPHHLYFDESEASSYDPLYKVNPPLRRLEDVMALREALVTGIIDIVATDHAPHSAEKKNCPWQLGSFGMLGLETALSVLQTTMVDSSLLSWDDIARVTSYAPAYIGNLYHQGEPLSVGANANITLVDPSAKVVIKADSIHSKAKNPPYIGQSLSGRIMYTFFQGKATFYDGKIVDL